MPEYSFFWGIFVPGLILSISTGVTFWLYRHFSTRDDGVSADKRNRIQRDPELKIAGEAGPGTGQEGITKGGP